MENITSSFVDDDSDIPFDLDPVPEGKYPYHLNNDGLRHQVRMKKQPVLSEQVTELYFRFADTKPQEFAALCDICSGSPSSSLSEAERLANREKLDADNLHRSRSRAKTKALLVARELRVDRLFTLSIRLIDGKPFPYDLVLTAFVKWRDSVRRKYPDFAYLAIPEKQLNGQYHWHLGVRGYFDVAELGLMWRKALNRVLGRPVHLVDGADSPGAVNVVKSERDRSRSGAFAAKQIARYMVKYMTKDFVVEAGRKSFYHSRVKIAKPSAAWCKAQKVETAVADYLKDHGLWDKELDVPLDGVYVSFRHCPETGVVLQAWVTYYWDLEQPPF